MKRRARKRSYLAKDDRHLALLDAAADVVEREGWPALSMISVADAAKVSRQLVYRHFPSPDGLMAETMAHLFRNRYEHVRRSIANPDITLKDLVGVVDAQTFDDPPARVRALWQMITATYSPNAETRRMGTRLRHLLTKLWAPVLAREFGMGESQARAVAWMLNMAFWGVHQLVDEGELSRKSAVETFSWLIEQLPQSSRTPRNARRR